MKANKENLQGKLIPVSSKIQKKISCMLTLNPEEASVQIFMKFHEVLKSLLMVIKQKTLAFTPYNNQLITT